MGYFRRHTIVVSDSIKSNIELAHVKALDYFSNRMVSNILNAPINEFYSFFIGPDGSKEGWDESNNYDELRDEYINWLKSNNMCMDWVYLQYGDDDGYTTLLDDSDKN